MSNVKYSRQREAILAFLKSTRCHPSADTVYAAVSRDIPNLSLGTVYRNLSKLCADGAAQKFEVDGCDRFDGDVRAHAHFVCTRCGAVSDIFTDYGAWLKDDAERKTGGSVSACAVVFRGVCAACRPAAFSSEILPPEKTEV